VLALRHGSVAEVIRDGVSGFVRDTEIELVEAMERLGEIDRSNCRREAEQRFSPRAMAEAYECVYDRVVRALSAPIVCGRGRIHALATPSGAGHQAQVASPPRQISSPISRALRTVEV
jgi:hypothetical protein